MVLDLGTEYYLIENYFEVHKEQNKILKDFKDTEKRVCVIVLQCKIGKQKSLYSSILPCAKNRCTCIKR